VISWYGSHPAEKIPGHYISKGFDPEHLQPGQVHPPDFAEVLREKARVRMRRRDLEDIVKSDFLRDTLLEDARTMSALRLLADPPSHDLVLCYFSGVDVLQHVGWRHMNPDTPSFPGDDPPDPRQADLIPAYYRYVDHNLGEILKLVPDDATLVVLSDHGAGPLDMQEAFRLRLGVLLEQLGLMDGTAGPALAIDEYFRHDKRIWLNLEGFEPAGFIPPEQARARAEELHAALARLTTNRGDPLFESIRNHTREPDWLLGDPALTVRFSTAALLTPAALDGERSYDFSAVRLRRSDVSGTHRPEGILILRGPGIEPGALPRAANHYNIAPTVLYLLGLPQDARMLALAPADGGVLEAAIRQDRLARHPVRAIPEYPGTDRSALLFAAPGSGDALPDIDPTMDASMDRLRSLGYVN
jgi:predicted AlkP superfamily phosphohydrolase/phosphomutase